MTDHDANLARVQALRDDQDGPEIVVRYSSGIEFVVTPEVCGDIEDVLTRHYPRSWYDELHRETRYMCEWCNGHRAEDPAAYWPWPCPDYTSGLALLDALDGGAK